LGDVSGNAIQAALFNILHPPAGFADKVVMMPLVCAEEIILLAVREEDSGNHPGFGQFIEDAVDCGETDSPEPGFDAVPDFIGGEVGLFSSQTVHNLLPSGRYLEF
jgi:hypothetical protein